MAAANQKGNTCEQYVWKIPRHLPEGFLPFSIPEHAKKMAATEWYKRRSAQAQLPTLSLRQNTDIFDIVLCERVMEQVCDLVARYCSKGFFSIFHSASSEIDSQTAYRLFLVDFLQPLFSRLSHLALIRPSALEIVLWDPKCVQLLLDSGHNLVSMAEMVLCSESFAFQTADRFLPCCPRDHLALKTILGYQARIGMQMLFALADKLNMTECLDRIEAIKQSIVAGCATAAACHRGLSPSELYPYVCPTLVVPYLAISKYNALFGLITPAAFDRLFFLAEMVKAKLVNIMNLGHAGAAIEVGLLLFDIGVHFHLVLDARFVDSLRQLNSKQAFAEEENDLQTVYPYDLDVLKNDHRRKNRVLMKYFVTRHIYDDLYKNVNNIMERRSTMPEKCCTRLRGAFLNEDAPSCVWQSLSWLTTLLSKVCELLNSKDPQFSAVFRKHTAVLLDNTHLRTFIFGESIHQASMNVYCNILTGKFNTLFNY